MSYIVRLKHLNLLTLKYRRLRGDMIEMYKIVNKKYDKNVLLNIPRNDECRTRVNQVQSKIKKYSHSL